MAYVIPIFWNIMHGISYSLLYMGARETFNYGIHRFFLFLGSIIYKVDMLTNILLLYIYFFLTRGTDAEII